MPLDETKFGLVRSISHVSEVVNRANSTENAELTPVGELPAGEQTLIAESISSTSDNIYQQRTRGISDRELLEYAADELDSAELTAGQRDALRIFNDRLGRLRELQEQRAELGQQYKEQQFTKGGSREQATQTKNRMDIIDAKIKSLENSVISLEDKDTLKQVLSKARDIAEKRERTRGQQALKEYRERRNESAAKTKYRARVRAEVDDLRQMIMKPSSKDAVRHVPAVIQKSVTDFISGIDLTSTRSLNGGEQTQADAVFIKNMKALRDAIKSNVEMQGAYSGYADLPEGFMEDFQRQIDGIQELINERGGEFVVNRMSAEELRDLAHTLRDLKRYIKDMNLFHNNAVFEHAYDAGEDTVSYLAKLGRAKGAKGAAYNFLGWQYMRPAYGFARLGKGGESIYNEFREGQSTQAFLAKKVLEFAGKTYSTKEVERWGKEIKTFKIGDETVSMPVTAAMSFYCLMKRPQALTHIFGEGIRVATFKNGKYTYRDGGHALTMEDAQKISASLTPRQKEVADALQKYMSVDCAEWGNYVHMKRFGVELYGEEYYFPINSDGRYLPATADESPSNAGLYALLNMGFTKELKEKATNRIVLYDVFDVFANHAASMAQYRSFALPVLDALKWFNYKNDATSVRDKMADAYGAPVEAKPGSGSRGYAEQFVLNILKSLNGTAAHGDVYDSIGLKALHRFNRAQVAFNGRVVIQQPMAITRAAMLLSPDKLTAGLRQSAEHMKALAAEMEAHSGIAAWKSLGFYDTNISRGLTSLIKGEKNFGEKETEAGLKGAELADRYTWAAMWYAAKESVKRSAYESEEEYFKAVTDLFEEVIYKTQVVDSVLTKAEFLRAQGFFPRMAGSFMSEPSTTISMLMDAGMKFTEDMQRGMSRSEAWQRNSRNIAKVLTVYAVGQVLLAAAESIADAWRDDDDYQTWIEKYLEALKGNVIDNLLPFGSVPVVSELYDLLKTVASKFGVDTYGNRVSNGWMQYADYLTKAAEIFGAMAQGKDTNYTTWGGIYNLLRGLSGLSGHPAATGLREAIDLWNNTVGAFLPDKKLKTYDAGVKSNIKYAYQDGYLNEDEALRHLQEDAGMTEEDARKAVAQWKHSSWDSNGNGVLSQAEVAAALEGNDEAEEIWKQFGWKTSYKEYMSSGSAEAKIQSSAGAYNNSNWEQALSDPDVDTGTMDKLVQAYAGEWETAAYTAIRGSGYTPKQALSMIDGMDTNSNDSVTQKEVYKYLSATMSADKAAQVWAAIAEAKGWQLNGVTRTYQYAVNSFG